MNPQCLFRFKDQEQRKEFKAHCAMLGLSMTEKIRELISQYLSEVKEAYKKAS